jgi:hypothetical protein
MAVTLLPQWPRTQSVETKQQSEVGNAIISLCTLLAVAANGEEKHGE